MLTTPPTAPGQAGARATDDDEGATGAPRPPGALLQALGWMAAPLAELARHRPALAVTLLGLDRAQLHLLGFALAHDGAGIGAATLAAAGGESVRAVLRSLRMEHLAGLGRVLRRLPEAPLPDGDYRDIAGVLADPATAAIVHHNTALIAPACLRNLASLPATLRTLPIALALDDVEDGVGLLMDWITLVADRRGEAADAQVSRQLATAGSVRELRARIVRLVDDLPVPAGLPPAVIDNAWRLETSAEIRRVARAFGNCLRGRVDEVACGTSLFYLWRAQDHAVVCELTRVNRLGWTLGEQKGPKNATPDDDVIRRIEADFRRAGVWPQRVATFGEVMVDHLGQDRHRLPRAAERLARLMRAGDALDDEDEDDDLPRRRPRGPGF